MYLSKVQDKLSVEDIGNIADCQKVSRLRRPAARRGRAWARPLRDYQQNRSIQNAEGTLNFRDKVRVPRSINQISLLK